MTVNEALHARRATPSFDKSVTITREEVLALIDEASLAPSSMNMQPWEFLVIETDEDKAKLKDVAMNQGKVTEASAVIVVIIKMYDFRRLSIFAVPDYQIFQTALSSTQQPRG